ncbi:CDP-glycerol glycerophosphotransferase family protein [Sulfuricurvum sp.]|uniref:CDP-glycerol glycerophosphotransferase family protein n=1 Tax=Sulfuricurvum sp. TaxID=2025608 RepID=UPI002612BA3F|nr:CDP-glycerol glycerophosphotransferase family protein [Sulfuricurvum sp.]MDD2780473.1 CDP-glycerol glycerophosphotransferase family protein [Sulfuricurvum sp.]
MAFDFNGKRVYIAPHTPRTTMFQKSFCEYYPNAECLGFIDKTKEGDEIFKLDTIIETPFDAILILSQNHFSSIYDDYTVHIPKSKLIKIDIIDNRYHFFDERDISRQKYAAIPQKLRMKFLSLLTRFIDAFGFKRSKNVFIAKSFVGTNTKMLYLHTATRYTNTVLLTDNQHQLSQFKIHGFPVAPLLSLKAIWNIAWGKNLIMDQGNYTEPLKHLSPHQKTIQMWHGIPLKRMNRLTDITYDYLVSTSDYVNETSLSHVIVAKEYKDYGYPRNDLLLKEHSEYDLLLCDHNLYKLAKSTFGTQTKVIVYMPTHREASTELENPKTPLIPLDFNLLDHSLKILNAILIVKLHPFIMQFYQSFAPEGGYEHIHFHSSQGDVYPILKYADILITDYSSVYFDFLLLNRPIIFFDYDYEEYSGNMGGFVYDYEKNAPGGKIKTQNDLIVILQSIVQDKESFASQRTNIKDLFFAYQDMYSSERIVKNLIKSSVIL